MKKIYWQPSVSISALNVADIVRTSAGVEFDVADWLTGYPEGGNQ